MTERASTDGATGNINKFECFVISLREAMIADLAQKVIPVILEFLASSWTIAWEATPAATRAVSTRCVCPCREGVVTSARLVPC